MTARALRRLLRDHGLSLVLLALTSVCLLAHVISGYYAARSSEPVAPNSLWDYARSAAFLASVFENWESEFLQMAVYVIATVRLYQRGSAESKNPRGGPELVDADPRAHREQPEAPWPVRRGGWVGRLYGSSLSIALFALFALSFALHACAHQRAIEARSGRRPALEDVLSDAPFWFESFQNWQSEFLSILALVVLSIFLRQRGSPESKPVHFPHARTGKD